VGDGVSNRNTFPEVWGLLGRDRRRFHVRSCNDAGRTALTVGDLAYRDNPIQRRASR
jgi:hypothetical protein